MSQEPWNEEIYETADSSEASRRSRSGRKKASTTIFTILMSIFIVLVMAIIALSVYLRAEVARQIRAKNFTIQVSPRVRAHQVVAVHHLLRQQLKKVVQKPLTNKQAQALQQLPLPMVQL